jgi:hypothetical protein
MAGLRDIVVDCSRAAPLARFWAAALDGYAVRPYDEEEIARLAGLGYTPDTDPTVFVDGPGPNICFQEVPEPKPGKNRLHLDLSAQDRAAETERLVTLGASIFEEYDGHTTLLDPEGNEFCILD